jgi:uncharacterized OsmC-like protein
VKKININYEGGFRCRISAEKFDDIITDAPAEDGGKEEAFSPTDMVVISLGSCMLTILAFSAKKYGIDIKDTKFEGYKKMYDSPRRIGEINITFNMCPGIPADKRKAIENGATACPVHRSLDPNIKYGIEFKYPD